MAELNLPVPGQDDDQWGVKVNAAIKEAYDNSKAAIATASTVAAVAGQLGAALPAAITATTNAETAAANANVAAQQARDATQGIIPARLSESNLDARYVNTDERGVANGVASLASDGKVPAAQLPAIDTLTQPQKDVLAQLTATGPSDFYWSIGNGAAQSFTLTHNLNTRRYTVSVFDGSGQYAEVTPDIRRPTLNTVVIDFSPWNITPTNAQYAVALIPVGAVATATSVTTQYVTDAVTSLGTAQDSARTTAINNLNTTLTAAYRAEIAVAVEQSLQQSFYGLT